MQECATRNIQDGTYLCSKDTLFAKDNHIRSVRQLNHTYLESMVGYNFTTQCYNTQVHPSGSGSSTFEQTLWRLDSYESCNRCSVTWLDYAHETPVKKLKHAHVHLRRSCVANNAVAIFLLEIFYCLMLLPVHTNHWYVFHSKQKAISCPTLARTWTS